MNAGQELSPRTIAHSLFASYSGKICIALTLNLLPVILPRMGMELVGRELTNEETGRIGGTVFAGLVLGVVLAGPLVDRYGVRLLALLGNLCIASGLLTLVFAQGTGMATLAAAIMGLGAGVVDLVICPLVATVQPNCRAAALNRLGSYYCFGAIAWILGLSGWFHLHLGWRTAVLILALFPLALAAGFAMRPWPSLAGRGGLQGRIPVLGSGWFLLSLVGIALCGAVEAGICIWLPTFATKGLLMSSLAGGTALIGFLACMAVGRFWAARQGHRISAPGLLLLAGVLALGQSLVVLLLPMSHAALIALISMGLPVGCLWPTMLAMCADRFPHGGATMFSVLVAIGNAGCFAMPWCIGLLADGTSFGWGLASLTACPFLLIVILGLQRLPAIAGRSAHG